MATRKYRELDALDPTIRQKISQSMKGRAKTEQHKQHLSQSMKDYWATIPSITSQTSDEENKREKNNLNETSL